MLVTTSQQRLSDKENRGLQEGGVMDTCTGCGEAVAANVFVTVNGTELPYCEHHGREYLEAWVLAGYHVVWDRRPNRVVPTVQDYAES